MPPRSDLRRPELRLSEEDRRLLLAIARKAILEVVCHPGIPDVPAVSGRLSEPGGAFVTVHRGGRLRGCIGHINSGNALAETVVQCAIGAALQDPRFRPLRSEEMAELEIEISALSELQPIRPEEIEAGLHGILITHGASRGLLLPQVAVERKWSAARFLEEACRKAELRPNAWSDPGTSLFAFTAEVFSEADFPAGAEPATGIKADGPLQRPAGRSDGSSA